MSRCSRHSTSTSQPATIWLISGVGRPYRATNRRNSSSRRDRVGPVACSTNGRSRLVARPAERARRSRSSGSVELVAQACFVDGAGEGGGVQDLGEVQERARGRGDRDAEVDGDVPRREGPGAVDADRPCAGDSSAAVTSMTGPHRIPHRPQRAARAVAQEGVGPTRQHGRHRPRMRRRRHVPHRVDAAVSQVQPPDRAPGTRSRCDPGRRRASWSAWTYPMLMRRHPATVNRRVWSVHMNYSGQVTTPSPKSAASGPTWAAAGPTSAAGPSGRRRVPRGRRRWGGGGMAGHAAEGGAPPPHPAAVCAYWRAFVTDSARTSGSGVSVRSTSERYCSNAGGSDSRWPSDDASSSTANPGPMVASSNSTPDGSRK